MKRNKLRFLFSVPMVSGLLLLLSLSVSRSSYAFGRTPVGVCDTFYLDEDSTVRDSTLDWSANLRQQMNQLIAGEMFTTTQLGLCIYDLTGDSVIYEYGSHQLMRPASVEKLLTSVTALSELGGSYQFATRLYMTGEVKDTVLNGDLYLVGGFDPRFGKDDMQAFIETLTGKGIRAINGRILADVSLKDTLKWGEGWCWDDDERTLTPLLYNGENNFMAKFFEQLNEEGIAHPMDYSNSLLPQSGATLLAVRTHTMDQILMRMLKHSDNLYAEALFYQLGAKDGIAYASAKQSAQKIYNFIRQLHLNPADYNVADGSGLSLYNYTTPEVIISTLRYVWQRNNLYLHLFPALPIAGVDGTLSSRMRSGCAYSNVHAKTGTLTGISSLAGYATAPNEHMLAFCIFNQGLRSSSAAHRFQDKVCRLMTCP